MSRSGFMPLSWLSHWGRGCITGHVVTKQATWVRVGPDITSHFSQEVGQSGPVNPSHYLIIWVRILRATELQDQISPRSVGELGLNPPRFSWSVLMWHQLRQIIRFPTSLSGDTQLFHSRSFSPEPVNTVGCVAAEEFALKSLIEFKCRFSFFMQWNFHQVRYEHELLFIRHRK